MTLQVSIGGSGPGMTKDEIDAYLAASTGGFTTEQLEQAFQAVRDAEHWKNPIDAVIDRSQVDVLTRAIPYYTGTPASFKDVGGQPDRVRVTADGYYAGPCN